MTKLDSTRTAITDKAYHWRRITANTPRGVKLQLINRAAKVAVYGTLSTNETFFTHWAPLPTFAETDDASEQETQEEVQA